MPATRVRPIPTQRLLDLAVLAVVAVPTAIVALACALAVRLTSSGPVLFRQERVGLHGEPFIVLKFRTMLDGPNPIFPDASRITSHGAHLTQRSPRDLRRMSRVLTALVSRFKFN